MCKISPLHVNNIGHVLWVAILDITFHWLFLWEQPTFLAVPRGTAKDGCQKHMACDVYMSKIVKFYTLNTFCDINYRQGCF